ncbi:hypothetical protein ABZ923_39885 [Streptomyces sp. NPDC046881]|uniref:hypothetical protein n=1 Tax=Streptomyces sp. NPDC046881 TaxID=3155374 RepID=UPI0033F45867
MDATIALRLITNRAANQAKEAQEARERLIGALQVDGPAHLDSLMREVLKAEGDAAPWRELMERVEHHGVREALAEQRERATTVLLEYGISMSTSPVSNEKNLADHEGHRRFLSYVASWEIEGETPAEEPAPATEEQPAPAPAVVDVPTATPAQKRTLAAIRDNGVKIQEFRVGKATVMVERGERPRKDMVEWVIAQGWADRDQSTSLFAGQAVTLTVIGEAILAG